MDRSDILRTITSALPNETLEILYQSGVWPEMTPFAADQNWWFKRTEYLVGKKLNWRPADWRRAYRQIEKHGLRFDVRGYYQYPLVIEILLQVLNPTGQSRTIMRCASRVSNLEVYRLLLADERIDPRIDGSYTMQALIVREEADIIELLLSDGRINPSTDNNIMIRAACRDGHLEIFKMLLADPRVNPSANDNECINDAVHYEYTEIVRLLLADPRVDPSDSDQTPIKTASAFGNTEIILLLLADKRVDPSANDDEPLREAAERGYTEAVSILLSDPRVDPAVENGYPLWKAIENDRIEVVRLLLNHQAVRILLDGTQVAGGNLGTAVRGSSIQMIKLLLSEGADPTIDDGYALRAAIQRRRDDVVDLLLQDPRVREQEEKRQMKRR